MNTPVTKIRNSTRNLISSMGEAYKKHLIDKLRSNKREISNEELHNELTWHDAVFNELLTNRIDAWEREINLIVTQIVEEDLASKFPKKK